MTNLYNKLVNDVREFTPLKTRFAAAAAGAAYVGGLVVSAAALLSTLETPLMPIGATLGIIGAVLTHSLTLEFTQDISVKDDSVLDKELSRKLRQRDVIDTPEGKKNFLSFFGGAAAMFAVLGGVASVTNSVPEQETESSASPLSEPDQNVGMALVPSMS